MYIVYKGIITLPITIALTVRDQKTGLSFARFLVPEHTTGGLIA
jgi:hypothetical protein